MPLSFPRWALSLSLLVVPAGPLLAASSPAPAPSQAGLEHQPATDVFSELARRQSLGQLDDATAWRLRGQALLAPDQLPPTLGALPLPALRCETPLRIDLYRHREHLDQPSRMRLEPRAPADDPPIGYDFPLKLRSDRFPITVHATSNSREAQAAYVLELAEKSWQKQVIELGFAAPLSDGTEGGDGNVDFYLAPPEETAGAYTQPTYRDHSSSDDVQSCPAYVVLNHDLNSTVGDPGEVMSVYVAHEFNHVLQAAMDFQELAWAWEVTATFMEDIVHDEVNDYYGYIPSFQENPQQNLVYFSESFSGDDPYLLYPYGATIFLHFLNEALAGKDPRVAVELWERTAQADTDNEPDFLDAIDEVAQERGWEGMDEVYARFSTWRYFTGAYDDAHHFEEGDQWRIEVPVLATYDLATLPKSGVVSGVSDYGATYLKVDTDGGGGRQLRVTLSSDSKARLAVIGSRLKEGAASEDVILVSDPDSGQVSGAIEVKDAEQVVIGILNAGRSSYDADGAPLKADIQYTIEGEEAGEGEGCGCTTRGPSKRRPATWGLVLVALWIGAQRRRVMM